MLNTIVHPAAEDNEAAAQKAPLLDIKNLKIWYKTYRGDSKVVDGINLSVSRGEKIGLVGESGCGKTTTIKAVLRLLSDQVAKIPEGEILLDNRDILKLSYSDLLQVRRQNIAMVPQEPMAALNPVFSVWQQMEDVIRYSGRFPKATKKDVRDICLRAIENVMISDGDRILKSYPHQLSGGMRQRICIAMALLTPRDLLIADEPGTALDVTIQSQIHQLLHDRSEENRLALIMITHSLGVARELANRIYIMYAGNIVEAADTTSLFRKPKHPYTVGLMQCVPRLSGGGVSAGIYGYVPDYVYPPQGCRFFSRCSEAMEVCRLKKPALGQVGESHYVACFRYDQDAVAQ